MYGITGYKHSEYKNQQIVIKLKKCVEKQDGTSVCRSSSESREWFKQANLLVFAPEHRPLLQEISKPDDPGQELDESVYLYRT